MSRWPRIDATPADGDPVYWRERLRYLLDYHDAFNDASELFEEAKKPIGLVNAQLRRLKVLDPAVGSGAFQMGVLQKLTLGTTPPRP